MPIVEITLIEGYADADRARLGHAVTQAVRQVIPAPAEAVTVLTHEVAPQNYMRGGQARQPASALPDPSAQARAFLAAMEARDLDAAQTFLAPDFVMHFPGAAPMHQLQQLVDWAKPRYRFVKKTYDHFDQAMSDLGPIVYCTGTLHGEWPDGTAFADIRFIDRFQFQDGLILRQDVWNDIAETRA